MPKSKRIKLTDIRIAIAKECLIYEDYSKETITKITKAYLKQLKKDSKDIEHWRYKKPPTISVNATKVQFEIEKLKKNGTFNNTN
jgi:hypothetical protein